MDNELIIDRHEQAALTLAQRKAVEAQIDAIMPAIQAIPPQWLWVLHERLGFLEAAFPIMELDWASVVEQITEMQADTQYGDLLELRNEDCDIDDVTWLATLPLLAKIEDRAWWAPLINKAARDSAWYDQMSDYLRDQRQYSMELGVKKLIAERGNTDVTE